MNGSFGEHASDQVGEKAKALGGSKVICIYDKGVKEMIGIPALKELNIREADLAVIAEGMTRDVCFRFLPVPLEVNGILELLQKAYAR